MTIPICCKNKEVEINQENIWDGDLFERQKVANDFTKIIKSIDESFVLSINSRYGSGKTFFLRRWAEELKQDEIVVFFNAWDCDFIEKPLLPFLYHFIEQLKEQKLVSYDLVNDLKNCGDIIFTCFKHFISKASEGIVNIDELKEKTDASSIKIPKVNDLCEYQNLQTILKNFKKDIEKLVETLNGKNIYIFVDELERCRPIFAIEVLEVIKHLFNIKGLVFILGIDRNQLKHTISNIYGCGMDGEGYLRRFIDLELELPAPDINKFTKYLQEKFEIVNKKSGDAGTWTNGYDNFNKYFNLFTLMYPLQLRDIEQIYAKFNVITKMLDENTIKIMPILALLLILKTSNTELYNKFIVENLSFENIDTFLDEIIFQKLNGHKITDTEESLLKNFVLLCRVFSKEDYGLILDELDMKYPEETQTPKKVQDEIKYYQRVYRLQDSYDCLNEDFITYLKNMISYINVE